MLAIIQTSEAKPWPIREVDDDLKYGQYVFFQPYKGSVWVKGWIGGFLPKEQEKAFLEAHPEGVAMAIRMSQYQKRASNKNNNPPP